MNKKNKQYYIPLHKSILGYKVMGFTIASFSIAIGIYLGFTNLGYYISSRYSPDNSYSDLIQTISGIASFAAFFWVFLAFMRRMVSDIKSMSIKLNKIADGELDLQIDMERKDELGDLARDINKMQESLINRMENERQAIQNNRELITSLSHDLRTPLTKQMCAIELAKRTDGIDEQTRQMLNRIYGNSEQIKQISDELFSYFIADDNCQNHQLDSDTYDGHTLFSQLISEYSDFLTSSGFTIWQKVDEKADYRIIVDISYLTRIMDNLASNIRKYADKNEPVKLSLKILDNVAQIVFENTVRADDGKMMDSNNIGINSAQKMAEAIGGKLTVALNENIYCAKLTLKINYMSKIQ